MERLFVGTEPLDDHLDRIVACDDRYPEPVIERILPDGAVHLIFNLRDRVVGERRAELPCLVMGPTCEPTRIVLTGAVEQVCVRLPMGSAAAVLGAPLGVLTNHGVPLEDLWGSAAGEALERLREAPSPEARVAWIAAAVRERRRREDPTARIAREAVRRVAASAGALRVGELAAQLGIGERRLQQVFHTHVGLSPKASCRLARFHAVLALHRRSPGRSWTEVAVDGGFYDHAHLVHELRAFTGLTPSELGRGEFGFFQAAAVATT